MILELVSDRTVGIAVEHIAHAITHVANSAVLSTDDGDSMRIIVHSEFGNALPVDIQTNALHEETLHRVVAQIEAMAPPKAPSTRNAPVDYSDEDPFTYNARTYPPVSLWHDATVQAMDTARGDVIPRLIEDIRASKLVGAATVGAMTRSVLHLYKGGLTAFAEETDGEITVTARNIEERASGWDGQASRDWTQLAPRDIVARAIDVATRSRNPSALEPGRRTVILSPAAVGQLVWQMAYAFDFGWTREGRMPFSFDSNQRAGRRTKMGMRVFDPRIVMTSDPADPDGGFPPFFDVDSDAENQLRGYPTPAVTWIDKGVLTRLACGVGEGLGRQLTPCDWPRSVRLSAAPGTPTASIDEMIANCSEGIYIQRFSDVTHVDLQSGMMTGVSRDGCFFVKDGKIVKPVKNFRFTDSPILAFNRLEMIGTPHRVAFGISPARNIGSRHRWPRLPVIVPPMMIRDFNFSALSDSV